MVVGSDAACCVTCPAGGRDRLLLGRSAVFHAVLEALDRAAEVGAYVLSFLVPNTMTTISSTISQCQMEKEPMNQLLSKALVQCSTHSAT